MAHAVVERSQETGLLILHFKKIWGKNFYTSICHIIHVATVTWMGEKFTHCVLCLLDGTQMTSPNAQKLLFNFSRNGHVTVSDNFWTTSRAATSGNIVIKVR